MESNQLTAERHKKTEIMKAKLEFNNEGESIIGYEGADEFAYPAAFNELNKCENVQLGEKIEPRMYKATIDDREYVVSQHIQKIHGFIRYILIAE